MKKHCERTRAKVRLNMLKIKLENTYISHGYLSGVLVFEKFSVYA
jgi:hypothetical protein